MITKKRNVFRPTFDMLSGLVDMICDFPAWMRNTPMIELGSYIGDSTKVFSLFFSPVYSIDPMIFNTIMGVHKSDAEVIRDFKINTDGKNVIHLKCLSDDAFEKPEWHNLLPKENIACVYIDANHCREFARRDIIHYWPMICENGFLCGHDYGIDTPEARKANQCGVKPAVDEIFGEPDRLYVDTSWVVQKKLGRMLTVK